MVNIGELLGRGEIANLFSEAVEEGEVYRLRLSINSEVNPHLPACRKELHYLLKATDYEFLEGEDRFVDCSDFKKISKERFAEMLLILINALFYIERVFLQEDDQSPEHRLEFRKEWSEPIVDRIMEMLKKMRAAGDEYGQMVCSGCWKVAN